MVILTAQSCTSATIRAESSGMPVTATKSSDPGKSFFYVPSELTPYLDGVSSSTTVVNKESTAPSSGTNRRTSARRSFVRRIKSLIDGGLIAGITPMSIRKRSPQKILDIASSAPAGADAGKQQEGS